MVSVYRLIADQGVFEDFLNSKSIFFNLEVKEAYKDFMEYKKLIGKKLENQRKASILLNGMSKIKKGDIVWICSEEIAIGSALKDSKFNKGFQIPFVFKKIKKEDLNEKILDLSSGIIFKEVKDQEIIKLSKEYLNQKNEIILRQGKVPAKIEIKAEKKETKKIKVPEDKNFGELIIEMHPPKEKRVYLRKNPELPAKISEKKGQLMKQTYAERQFELFLNWQKLNFEMLLETQRIFLEKILEILD